MEDRESYKAQEKQEHGELYQYIKEHGLPDEDTFYSMIVEQNLAADPECYSDVEETMDSNENDGDDKNETNNLNAPTEENKMPEKEVDNTIQHKKPSVVIAIGSQPRMSALKRKSAE
jgi:hypothetical protein